MKHFAAVVLAVPVLFAQTASTPLRVTGIRHWQLGEVTRIAVEVSGSFDFRTDHLHNPERVYFDILNAHPKLETRPSIAAGDTLLKKIRVAETTPGTTRIVLDLADGVEAATSQLINPNRLMIELRIGAAPAAPPPDPVTPPPSLPRPKPTSVPSAPLSKPPVSAGTAPPATPELVAKVVPVKADPAPPMPPLLAKVESPTLTPPPAALPLAAPAPVATAVPLEKPKSAKLTSDGESSLIRTLGLKINRVVLDPGHGGHDEGTMGPKGLLEKDLVLDVAQRLGKLIEQRMGAEVIFTRTDDTFIPLEGRTALANEKMADLFLSIHANSSPARGVTGIETYYLNFTDSQDSLAVAARENASAQKTVFELHDLIQKITLHDKAEESREFANRIQTSLQALSARSFPGEKNRGVRKAPFVVLIGAQMPSVLAEIGFLSNAREESLLKRSDYRQKIAEALFKGLSRYADGLSHFQVAKN
jgi:N-acetylmuramoyl-L-alanine amidase